MGATMGKLICDKLISGEIEPRSITTPIGNQGAYVKTLAGVGNPYWWFTTAPPVPAGFKMSVDYTDAPIASADAAVNNANIAAITTLFEEVVTFVPRVEAE